VVDPGMLVSQVGDAALQAVEDGGHTVRYPRRA
jgi:hypothetical protein